MTLAMYIFGFLTIISACGVVFSTKTLHSALALVTTFFLVGVHYALLGADFLAVLQVMVYAGAIMVLVIFVIMLLGLNEEVDKARLSLLSYVAVVVTGAFVGLLLFVVNHPSIMSVAAVPLSPGSTDLAVASSPKEVGSVLFTKFLFPFEVTSVLLLAAIVGAVVIAHEPKRPLPPGRGLRAKRANVD